MALLYCLGSSNSPKISSKDRQNADKNKISRNNTINKNNQPIGANEPIGVKAKTKTE